VSVRSRAAVSFYAGFCIGALALYAVLVWTGALPRTPAAAPAAAPAATTLPGVAAPPASPGAPPILPSPAVTPLPGIVPSAEPSAPATTFLPEPPPFTFPAEPPPPTPPPLDIHSPNEPPRTVPNPPPDLTDYDRLRARALAVPVQGLTARDIKDNFAELRGARPHEAIDMLAARGTPVVAVAEGTVKKLFTSDRGGLTVYQFDPEQAYCYYYAHLDRYAQGLAEGKRLAKGEVLGYVGTSGNAPANTPHLHFTIFRLGPEKHWWEGTPINPYPLWALKK
jgi:murein DD-endopeptidase MepM/ murein hydrolase activator NlpD